MVVLMMLGEGADLVELFSLAATATLVPVATVIG